MQAVQDFFNSFSVEQWAAILGFLTWAAHTVLNRNKKLSSELNKFIARFTTLVFPIATAVALDPNVQAIVHNYFPALVGFFTAYQGLYLFTTALAKKLDTLREQFKASKAVTEQVV